MLPIMLALALSVTPTAAQTTPDSVATQTKGPNSAATQTPPDSIASSLDAYVREQMARGFRGAVLVAVDGRIVLQNLYGAAPAPDGQEPAFWLASNSKQFAAAAILRLQDEGKLSVHDPIARFLPKVPADKRNITIHHLLTHTAGFRHSYLADGIIDRSKAVQAILAAPLGWPVGAAHHYSNDGYVLLAAIVEIAAGIPFEDYLRAQLFRPVGMERTGFWGHETDVPIPIASMQDPSAARKIRATIYAKGASRPNWGYRGATGVFGTTGDLYKWMRALHEGRILSDSARAQLFAPVVQVRGTAYYGYGWGVIQRDGKFFAANHAGTEDWLGHNGVIWMYSNGDVVIVLSNAGEQGEESWSKPVARGIRERLRR